MSFPALEILGEIISKKSSWPLNDRLSIWSVCLTTFWGAFRLGKLISNRANTLGFHTLKWSHISFVLLVYLYTYQWLPACCKTIHSLKLGLKSALAKVVGSD